MRVVRDVLVLLLRWRIVTGGFKGGAAILIIRCPHIVRAERLKGCTGLRLPQLKESRASLRTKNAFAFARFWVGPTALVADLAEQVCCCSSVVLQLDS